MSQPRLDPELLISHLLRLGVAVSFILVLTGMVLTFAHHPDYLTSPTALSALISPAELPHTFSRVIEGCLAESGQAFVLLGLLVLVATPVVRVALSVLIFHQQRDHVFVAITTTVLLLLILSFAV